MDCRESAACEPGRIADAIVKACPKNAGSLAAGAGVDALLRMPCGITLRGG